jgi:O-methyltransferase
LTDLTFDMEPEFKLLYEICRAETMTSIERMHALWSAVRYVCAAGIPGDIVECGVWRGGSMMLAAQTLTEAGDVARGLWLYDTFEGMTAPGAADVQAMSGRAAEDILSGEAKSGENPFWAIANRQLVEANMARTGYPQRNLHFIEGRVEDTIPAVVPGAVSILRLDTDWYESTRHELTHLWPRLSKGGVLIVDDYGYWQGARRAVDEHLASLIDPPMLARVDFTGRVAVKR